MNVTRLQENPTVRSLLHSCDVNHPLLYPKSSLVFPPRETLRLHQFAVPSREENTGMSWEAEYTRKIQTADDALHMLQSGMRVYIQPGCAEPEALVEAMMHRAPDVRDVEVVHMRTMGAAPYVAPEMAPHFRHKA